MLVCVHDVNGALLDIAHLHSVQPEHMCWKWWLVFQHIQIRVLTSKTLGILGFTLRRSYLRNENLPNICIFSDG